MMSLPRALSMFLLYLWVGVLWTNVMPVSKAGQTSRSASEFCYLQRAALGVEALQDWYDWSTGRWHTTNWWGAANSTTVLVNYSMLSGSSDYQSAVENTFNANYSSSFVNTIH